MKEYTPKQIKVLQANPYTFKMTTKKLYSWIEKQERYAIKFCKETVFTGKMVMA